MDERLFVVAGIDGTGNSLLAADRAAEEAKLRGWPLRLVYALDPDRPLGPSNGFDLLTTAAERVRRRQPDVPVSTVLGLGNPDEVLRSYTADCGLLVLGNRGRGELAGMRHSVALHLLPTLTVPLLVVRVPGLPEFSQRSARSVVVGVDGTPSSEAAATAAIAEARLRSAPLIAVHATMRESAYSDRTPDPLHSGPLADDELLSGVALRRVPVEVDPRAALLGFSRQACLVVVGSRGRGALTGYLFGSVGQALIRMAHCPVMIVRRPSSAAERASREGAARSLADSAAA
ncbi:MAG: universal stress protein [Hamadaea sp.]|uniref:universal stress protein n=1 Tax=Hamadaea sp. TaxID=2024425 RepID=UPI0017D1FF20|nr:universal stress protein [Hamadaea sp.]NUT18854.1 universal stress protein [Hamadaea sp.]